MNTLSQPWKDWCMVQFFSHFHCWTGFVRSSSPLGQSHSDHPLVASSTVVSTSGTVISRPPWFVLFWHDLLSQPAHVSKGKHNFLLSWRLSCSTSRQNDFSEEVSRLAAAPRRLAINHIYEECWLGHQTRNWFTWSYIHPSSRISPFPL